MSRTTITDTLYGLAGDKFAGTAVITLVGASYSTDRTLVPAAKTVTITDGVLSVVLESNATITPANTYYVAKFEDADGAGWREYWSVPVSVPAVTLSAVRIASTVSPTLTINPSQIDDGGASAGQALIWSGTAWEPAAIAASSIAPSGITAGGAAATQALIWNGSNWVPTTLSIPPSGITAGGAASNQVLTWNGSAWAPAATQTPADTVYADTYWDDALVQVGTLTNGATPADPIDFGPSGTYRPKCFGFGVGEDMDGSLQFSHRYKEGTDIQMHVHWAPVTAAAGRVQWSIHLYWLNAGGAAVGDPTALVVETVCPGVAWQHMISNFPLSIGVGKTISSIVMFKIRRIAATTAEYGADAALMSVDGHYEIDRPGSRDMLLK
jgi:hypothetical protein